MTPQQHLQPSDSTRRAPKHWSAMLPSTQLQASPGAKQSGDQASPESGRAASGFRRTGQHRPLRTPPHPPGWGRNHPQNETVVTQLRRELAKGQGWVLAESQAGGEEPQGTSPPL